MAALLISYDLNAQGQNYACITKKLEAYETHWRFQRSVWMIQTDESELELATKLSACLDANDDLFIIRVAKTSAWAGFAPEGDEWFETVI